MNQDELRNRVNKLLAEERKNPLQWWYLSYANETSFIGAVYIQAHGPTEAAYLSRRRNISPGGELYICPVPSDAKLPEPHYLNRLLTKQEVQDANPGEVCMTIAEFEAEEKGE